MKKIIISLFIVCFMWNVACSEDVQPDSDISKSSLPNTINALKVTTGFKTGTLWGQNGGDIFYDGGNVGIGTLNPFQQLHIHGDNSTIFMSDLTSGGTQAIVGDGNLSFAAEAGINIIADVNGKDNPKNGVIKFGGGGDDDYTQRSMGNLAYPRVEWMRIDPNGNVGIGTKNPMSSLQIRNAFSFHDGGDTIIGFGCDPYNTLRAGYPAEIRWSPADDDDSGSLSLNITSSKLEIGDPPNLWGKNNFVIKSTGNVGIGTSNPTEKFHVNGNIICNVMTQTSDIRYKKNITPIKDSLQKIIQLKGVKYEWKQEEYPEKDFSEGKQIGLIAQDVEPVIPEIVHTDSEGFKSVSYDKLTVLLIEAVKELKAENKILKKIICDEYPEKEICQNQ